MELGLGHLGLMPDQLWSLTFPEWNAKISGFMEFHGVQEHAAPMNRDEMEAMIEEFPDGPPSREYRRKRKALRENGGGDT